jgi:phenylalanyl-tRNA synthetase beta chain
MIGVDEDDRFVSEGSRPPLALTNPIAEPLTRLRRSILPGLVRAADLNLRRGNRDVRLFEVGRVFRTEGEAKEPAEPIRVGAAWCGAAEPPHWSRSDRPVDLYDVIGLAERLLDGLRPGHTWTRASGALAAFHPARSVHWLAPDGTKLAWGGALHPELARDMDHDLYVLEMDVDRLAALPHLPTRQQPVPRVPSVTRDLSLVLTADQHYGDLLASLAAVEAPAPARFAALDRYEGAPLQPGETALTIRVTLEPLEQTLTDAEIEGYRQALVDRLGSAHGVRIRS